VQGKMLSCQDTFQTGIMSDLDAVKNKDYQGEKKNSQKQKISPSGEL